MKFELLHAKTVYKGRAFNVRRDTLRTPDGHVVKYDIIGHIGSVSIVPVDAHGLMYFVRQYRHAAKIELLELPAGTLEVGEPPMEAAAREIREETGMEAEKLVEIGAFYLAPGYSTELMHVFLASGLKYNPLEADADFDGLVDGQEFNWNSGLYRSDPNKANTDGDSRTDGEEWPLLLNPLVEDFLVTVVYQSLKITNDGDSGTDAGDFSFELNVRLPSSTSLTGLANPTMVVSSGLVRSVLPTSSDITRSLVNNDSAGVLQIRDDVLNVLDLTQLLPFQGIGGRSYSFSVATNQRFSVEGIIDEVDSLEFDDLVRIRYGGLEGLKAKKDGGAEVRTVFEGSSLVRGSITDLTFSFTHADNLIIGSPSGSTIVGELRAMIIVS